MLFVPLTAILQSGKLYAQTDAEYDAAMAAIKDGCVRYIVTEEQGVKFYVDSDGNLTEFEENACKFVLTKRSGGTYKDVGIRIAGANGFFSNTLQANSKANLNPGKFCLTTLDRDTYERQVFFLNKEGKFAIRTCNVAHGTSGWADCARVFWTYEVGEIDMFLTPCYSYDPAYIWTLEAVSDEEEVMTILNSIFTKYDALIYDTYDSPISLDLGTSPGQYGDIDTWHKLWTLLQEVNDNWNKMSEEGYDYTSDPNALTVAQAYAMSTAADSMYQKIIDSEIPYSLPNGDGYYRIISRLLYSSPDAPTGYVDKAFAASISSEHANKGVYATIDRDRANFLWKLTQHGDSIEIQNAGMGTYISFSSPGGNRVIMTDAENDRTHVTFDYAGFDYITEDDKDGKDIFYIRLSSKPRGGGNYLHQLSHSAKADENTMTGNSGTDSGKEMELSFWSGTYNNGTDKGTSEWYLEYVPEDEAKGLIDAFAYIRDHDVLVEKNNALRAKVNEALLMAKDSIRTNLITDASQMTSPYSHNDINGGSRDGGDLSAGVLIDGDKTTYWHSSWGALKDEFPHYLQLSGMKGMVGNCELYLCQRAATNDHPKEFTIVGSNDPEADDESWTEMAVVAIPNVLTGEENTVPFFISEPYEYVRLLCTQQAPSNRNFWHAAELQILSVAENPNSQYASLGEVAEVLDRTYHENIKVADEDITPALYESLFNAYEAFLKAMVDPTELRNALAAYADLTKCVVEGAEPGQWKNTDIATAFDALYKEVQDYNEAGRYTVAQNHKYAVMLKAMAKTVMEGANGITTDKWYRIMFPTEEMYTKYNLDPAGVGGKSDYEDQPYMFGSFIAPGVRTSETEKVKNEETGEESEVTHYFVNPVGGKDIRDGYGMYMFADDLIEDKDASMFRFIERETDAADYTPLFSDVKENMLMALDMSTTYTKGEALITDASQFTSNASYPGNDGQKLESGCLIDNNLSTYWHSDYSKTYCAVPYLQVALNEPVSGLIQVYVGRRQGAASGHVVRMYVQGSNDAENWTNVGYIEIPFIDAATPVTSQPIDLGGSFSYLRFTMTNRYGSDGGSNIEFDPFAENLTADDYNTKFTYFHASEFQIYPVTADKELSASGKELQQAFATANKVVLKDATAEDYSAAAKAYKAYQSEFNVSVGKAVLPDGLEKAAPSYAIQNKATGLYVYAKGTNTNDVALRLIPTFFEYSAMGYERSLLHGTNPDGKNCAYLHVQNSNHRFCTWNDTKITTNSPLIIREADEKYVAPTEFTFYKDVKPGKIYNWCNSVTVTPQDAPDGACAYTAVGHYSNEEGMFLALKTIETIEAGKPAFFIYGDTLSYESDKDDAEAVMFTMAADQEFVLEGDSVNGAIGILGDHTLLPHEFYFSGNHPVWIKTTGYYVYPYGGWGVVIDLYSCPQVDPEADYDFSICLAQGDEETGLKNVSSVVEQISKPGAVYSLDGRLLRTGATLNSLKALGRGIYILNGVKVVVK